MATIYCYKDFNNYFNRKLKGQDIDNISDFITTYGEYDYMQSGTYDNFNLGDGVTTKHVLGQQNNPYFGDCSYFLYCADNINITSRWYIIDHQKKCFGQYELTLYRDVLAENWDKILDSPMFIEKATVPDDSPFIFNQEQMSFNKIKTAEQLLTDSSGCAWVVGYLAKNYVTPSTITLTSDVLAEYEEYGLEDIETILEASVNTTYNELSALRFSFYAWYNNKRYTVSCMPTGVWTITDIQQIDPSSNSFITNISPFQMTDRLNDLNTLPLSYIKKNYAGIEDSDSTSSWYITAYNNIINNKGKVFKLTSTNAFYKITITQNSLSNSYISNVGTLLADLNQKLVAYRGSGNIDKFFYDINYNTAKWNYHEVAEGQYQLNLTNSRIHCKEAFDMFCIPYFNGVVKNTYNVSETARLNKDFVLALSQELAAELGSNLYDLQLLPYCPASGLVFNTANNTIDLNTQDSLRYDFITHYGTTTAACPLIWCDTNRGSKNIEYVYTTNAANLKIDSQTRIYRLCSPNYNGQYEFSADKNSRGGKYNIDYTYIPYTPYIHVAPVFEATGMYGKDYNDAVGLICGGDFSISYISDAWTEYKIQNKNYESIFDRQIQNMDVTHKYEKVSSIVQTAAGALGSGVMAGMMMGPAMGITGALVSGAAGAADVVITEQLYKENKDYQTDMYNANLENVQALPYSLNKVSAINENNKLFPFIEVYDCTIEEKIALANKIKYNGMTLNIIDKPSKYINNTWSYTPWLGGETYTDLGYIKGRLINTNISEDTHICNTIKNELELGIYTK